jgi:hypothetical protein
MYQIDQQCPSVALCKGGSGKIESTSRPTVIAYAYGKTIKPDIVVEIGDLTKWIF